MVGAPNSYLDILDKLEKEVCRAAGATHADSLEPKAHCPSMVKVCSTGFTQEDVHRNWLD